LRHKFENLGGALRFAYPEINWDLTKFSLRGKKSGQRWLKVLVRQLLPGMEIVEDYRHPDLILGVMFTFVVGVCSLISFLRARLMDSAV
jgi:hypothetical protein